ncbi:MAG TPA: PAS domain S-box protein [Flavisolibacter sp.]|nr:PAS domain S-box protein [Flavisolibacter sp.]
MYPFSKYQKLLDSLAEVVCAIDEEGHFVYINQACKEVWGYEPEELIGTCCFELIVNDDRDASYQALNQYLKDNVARECENEYYHKDGSIVAMSWVGRWDKKDGLLYTTGKNVTERRKQEKEMEMLSLIARETVNSIVVMDPDFRITWVNTAFINTTGYTFYEAVGKAPYDLLLGPDTDKKLIQQTNEKLKNGEAGTIEIVGYTKKKRPYWSSIQFQPLFDKKGNLDKIIAIVTDITEKKKLQTKLDLQLSRQQKRITAAVIQAQENERTQLGRELHDNVNQVLTTVKLFNEIIGESVTKHKDLVQRSAVYLQTCIDEIRRISKRLSIPPLSEVGLIELTRELVDSINLTNKLEVTYSLKGMHEIPISQELQLAIYRIMQEQLNNIIKHADATMVTIALAYENNQLRLAIKDNGKGFDPQARRSGIGITNIRSRAESLDGAFQLESAPGKGCLIKITFPLFAEVSLS